MKKQLLTIIFALTIFCLKAQTPLVTGSNLHGFAFSGLATISYTSSNYVKLTSGPPTVHGYLDTNIIMNSFDYIIVSFLVQKSSNGNATAFFLGEPYPLPGTGFGVNITDTIFSGGNLTIDISMAAGATVYVSGFTMVGYNTVGLKNETTNQLNIFTSSNKIKTIGKINPNQKLNIINMLGQTVFTCALQEEITTNLPSCVYNLQVVDANNKAVLSKKVFIGE